MKVMPKDISKSYYHSILRISMLVFTLALVFVSGILNSSTQTLSVTTGHQLANLMAVEIGMPESLEVMSEDIVNDEAEPLNKATFLIATVLFILLLLTILNYVLYYLRQREKFVTVNLYRF